PEKTGSQEAVKVSETVRIDVQRLDNLMNQIGELVVARTAFTRVGSILSARYREDQDVLSLTRTITNISKIVDDLQLDITEARMMPVGTVFNRFPRMVRDLAQKAGKQIEFIVEGQETGIDRSVIEHIRDPLVHLLRNAVDHGIELPEKRRASGKPEKGTIRLSAAHEQSYIAITVEDDGRGIDGARLKEVAVKKGLLSAEAAGRIDDIEAVDLIFEAGLSTAEKVTDVSGRGVGMDIVRQNIESLNGHIAVSTKIGEGTKFVLRLPLTLATIHGLLIVSSGVTFAIPLVTVSEVLRLRPEEIQTVTQREVIRIRDRIVPLLKLDEVLRLRSQDSSHDGTINVVVVKAGERMVGLTIDSFREPQEVVVKSLGAFIGDVKGIAGASILGTGEVALILDVPSLVKLVVMGE
ncbi:MAG: chemotaxis protein CheA, partial [Chloroflexi bacterium]|nr:chemotaxis protein CheA [Chloroflexota bacterium]